MRVCSQRIKYDGEGRQNGSAVEAQECWLVLVAAAETTTLLLPPPPVSIQWAFQ